MRSPRSLRATRDGIVMRCSRTALAVTVDMGASGRLRASLPGNKNAPAGELRRRGVGPAVKPAGLPSTTPVSVPASGSKRHSGVARRRPFRSEVRCAPIVSNGSIFFTRRDGVRNLRDPSRPRKSGIARWGLSSGPSPSGLNALPAVLLRARAIARVRGFPRARAARSRSETAPLGDRLRSVRRRAPRPGAS